MKTWRIRSGMDRRFRSGHPWVYSNELTESPKGIEPGESIELLDAKGAFLARGFGNPSSLIAFRAVTRKVEDTDPTAAEFLLLRLKQAARLRELSGWSSASHRLCFGEADGLPGLIIDRFILKEAQVFVIQAHTAGMNRLVSRLVEIFPEFLEETQSPIDWNHTAVVLRNDVAFRKLEGLEVEPPRILKSVDGLELSDSTILVAEASRQKTNPLSFCVDLVGGQKTGFFLDQAGNVQLAVSRLAHLRPHNGKTMKILDLFCYVGQWGAQLARFYRSQGYAVEVTAVDASAEALELARANIEAEGATCVPVRADVVEELSKRAEFAKDRSFDIVVCDPPALIKGRKDLGPGAHAYLQLNTQVFRLVRDGGGVVTCSCSGLFSEDDFIAALAKAARRNNRDVRWVGRGAQAPDHPMLPEFPEGRYLKAWIGLSLS